MFSLLNIPHILAVFNAVLLSVWEVKFHESYPDNLFSCSEDGSVWHWDGSNINAPAMAVGQGKGTYLCKHERNPDLLCKVFASLK